MKASASSMDQELYKRILLSHRFGLSLSHTVLKGHRYPLEDLPFDIALEELKYSFSEFITQKENIEKLLHILRYALIFKLPTFSIEDSHQIIQSITGTLLDFYTPAYFANLTELKSLPPILLLPLKTIDSNGESSADSSGSISEKIKAIALFEDRLIKINDLGALKTPGIKIYRTRIQDRAALLNVIQTYLQSFEQAGLDAKQWDKALNLITQPEKIRQITKKEQSVGNGSWLTCKLLIFATVYASIFKYCKDQGLKELEIDPIAVHISESWYKLFIVDDRNRAVYEYLKLHGFLELEQPLSVAGRVNSIKQFLQDPKVSTLPLDKDILIQIRLKSLNWLLADYLKKGDIGEAHALIEEELDNDLWHPLIYAAKNGKNAIAEMLASNARYIKDQDPQGNTPLHWASAQGYFEICTIFLRYQNKNRIQINAQNHLGDTALHKAIRHSKLDIVGLLLKTDPTLLNIRNQQNQSALKLACDLGHTEAVLFLLRRGASIEGIAISEYPEDIQKLLNNAPKFSGPGLL